MTEGAGAGVVCTRGGVVESVHRVHVAVVDEEEGRVAVRGVPGLRTYYRSAAKPLQALPLVEDGVADAAGFGAEELATCCASHGGEPAHVDAVREILERVGLEEDALECGPHPPSHEASARALRDAGEEPRPIHNNCSGKHAGMLALAVHHGWPTEGYRLPDHPVQERMLREVARWSGAPEEEIDRGIDGCGVVCFGTSLERMALSFARFAAAAGRGEPASRIVRAMTGAPFHVAGTGRVGSRLLEVAGDRVFAKTGAEGVFCAGIPGKGCGVALKVEDGAGRAKGPALLRVLSELGVVTGDALEALADFAEPGISNTRGEEVGRIRCDFGVVPAGARAPGGTS